MNDERSWAPPDDDNPKELAHYYASLGWSHKVIAMKMGISAVTAEKLLAPPKEKIVNDEKKKNRNVPMPTTLADDFNSGILVKDLAVKYNVGQTLVWIWIRSLGLKRKRVREYRYAMPCKRELEILLSERVTMKKMAEQYEVSTQTIKEWLNRYDLRGKNAI